MTRSTSHKVRKATGIFLAVVLSLETAFAPYASAQGRSGATCESLFDVHHAAISTDGATLKASLPPEFIGLLGQIPEPILAKFESRFQKRERIKAEAEAEHLAAVLLTMNGSTSFKVRSFFDQELRNHTQRRVLHSRLDVLSAEVRLEKILLEIGYKSNSKLSQRWADFRHRNFRKLDSVKRAAVNTATSLVAGVPLYLKPFQYQQFHASRVDKQNWDTVEAKLRALIDARDRKNLRDLRIEAALKVIGYIMAAAVLAILTDELLDLLTPKWALLKGRVGGTISMESREELEMQAIENWKDVIEAFAQTRPTDESPETVEMRRRVHAASRDELWLHVHGNGPLPE